MLQMAAVLFAILCAAWLPMSLQQIVPADLGGLSGFCPVSQEALRVLPSSGFTRSVLQPFTTTTLAGSQEPLPLAANLTECLFQSYDPAFDAIIGDNRTVYQVGPTRSEPWAVESPAYLPGITLPNLVVGRTVQAFRKGRILVVTAVLSFMEEIFRLFTLIASFRSAEHVYGMRCNSVMCGPPT